MILKMKLVNLAGTRCDIDRVIEEYLLGEDIEFENPLSVFKNTRGFTPHTEPNPYISVIKRFTEIFEYVGIHFEHIKGRKGAFSSENLSSFIEKFDEQIHSLKNKIHELEDERAGLLKTAENLEPILNADVSLDSLNKLEHLKFRFGRLPKESFLRLEKYLEDLPAYFADVKSDSGYVWGFFFTTAEKFARVDHIFSSLYFESFWIDINYSGTPKEIYEHISNRIDEITGEISSITDKMKNLLNIQKTDLLDAYASMKYYYDLNNLKKYAVYTKHDFYFTFWAEASLAEKLSKKADDVPDIKIVLEEPSSVSGITVPTKLKNNIFTRPFEDFIKMYGIPKYNEIDPTSFLAVIYTLLFGMMFGDLGHGAVLAVFGLLLTLMKKGGFLAKILIPLGISSSVFGLLYGTCFGFEGEHAIIPPLWFTPMEEKTRILLITVAIGVAIILMCMLFNIINGVKQKNVQKIFFSQNGLAGILFYTFVLYTAISMIFKSENPKFAIVLIILISLGVIFLQEPLKELCERKKNWMPKEKGSFFVQSFFELFEIVLSFVTNSMSFVRVGAFALNHAGMMSVVLMFMEGASGAGLVAVTILGNALVIGLEGLIVGIQVLRLGFYEMFSRFYDGGGRPFKSIKNN